MMRSCRVQDNGGMLPFNGRSNKEVFESEQPDIDIFVCDSEERYDRAVERFLTSNQTRVYLARQIYAWINDGSFQLYRPVIKNMPGRRPGVMYRYPVPHPHVESATLIDLVPGATSPMRTRSCCVGSSLDGVLTQTMVVAKVVRPTNR